VYHAKHLLVLTVWDFVAHPKTGDAVVGDTTEVAHSGKGVPEVIFNPIWDCEEKLFGTALDERNRRHEDQDSDYTGCQWIPTIPPYQVDQSSRNHDRSTAHSIRENMEPDTMHIFVFV
jgi:hypothetical protein